MQDMAVTLSDEDFEAIYEALRRVNHPYSHDDAGEIVKLERQAWEAVQRYRQPGVSRRRIRRKAAQSGPLPSSGESQPS